ncbi:ChaB family protein [Cryobacterium tepidiphilum]|uniref:Cation transport regulator ChaB n=1 Tax=Cryobacterium tepidiphilum TaxID=2486026 RepID=A0A3M8L3T5_9MICO|nr:ChaB family protein [Cryobacterium tepidiphilum]RNE59314.1 cation transport regulator ChaB [Cryobacterium tepidiphilum]
MPASEEMPDTIRRSPKHAQDLWSKVHDSAVKEYGEGERSHRTAFAALKNEYEKVGDHWEEKEKRGPSDDRAAGDPDADTAGGVNANASKEHLYDVAKRLDISGRSDMSKDGLVKAIEKENAKRTRQSD